MSVIGFVVFVSESWCYHLVFIFLAGVDEQWIMDLVMKTIESGFVSIVFLLSLLLFLI